MTRVTIVCEPDPGVAEHLRSHLGGVARVYAALSELREHVATAFAEDTIVLGPGVSESESFAIADYMRVHRPSLGVVLVRTEVTTPLLQDALRAGVREVVDHRDLLGLQSAVKRSAALSAALREQATAGPATPAQGQVVARGTIVTVFSAKGGCGKTTLATNLAAALADRGRREVVIVDMDLSFGDVAIALQLFPAHTVADALPMASSLDGEALRAILTPHSPGLSALVAPVDPGTGESVPATLVTKILELLREQFDYVVVDTPPAFDDQVLAAIDVSDVVALIATLDVPALKNLKLTLETLELLNYPKDRWHVVLNRADSKVGLTVKDVEDTLRTPIAAHIPSSRDVPSAINRGVPIMLDDPKHPVSVAIRAFAEGRIAHAAVVRANGATNGARTAEAAALRGERRSLIRKRRPKT
jgi:pilus assembly protein CpaE